MKNEICVSAEALNLAGESGGAVGPAVGDEVEFSGKGTVTRTEGGEVYFTASEINGQPVMGAEEGNETGAEDMALDAEVQGMQGGAGAMGGMLLTLVLCLLGLNAGAKDVEFWKNRTCSGTAVSNYVAVTRAAQGGFVEIDNNSGATLYLLVFDSATNSLTGRTPHFTAVPVLTGTVGGKAFSSGGAPFLYGINVCLSTTPYSLTNASSGGVATVIWSPLQ